MVLEQFGAAGDGTNSWAISAEFAPVTGFDKSNGRVYLAGRLHNGGDSIGVGTLFTADQGLTEGFRPAMPCAFTVAIYNEGIFWEGPKYGYAQIEIQPDGSITYRLLGGGYEAFEGNGASWLSLEGISFIAP